MGKGSVIPPFLPKVALKRLNLHCFFSFFIAVKFVTKPRNTTVAVGKSTVLRCNASGTPHPDISWGKEHGGMDKKRFRQLTNGNLHIRDARMADAGQYFCVASNKDDLKEAKLTLKVIGRLDHRFTTLMWLTMILDSCVGLY